MKNRTELNLDWTLNWHNFSISQEKLVILHQFLAKKCVSKKEILTLRCRAPGLFLWCRAHEQIPHIMVSPAFGENITILCKSKIKSSPG